VPKQKSPDAPLCNNVTQHLPDCDLRRWVAATEDSYQSSRNLAWSRLDLSCMIPSCLHPNIINFLRSRLRQRAVWRHPPSLASSVCWPATSISDASPSDDRALTYQQPDTARKFLWTVSVSWRDDYCPVNDFNQWVFCRWTFNRRWRLCYDTKFGHRETGGLQKQITVQGQAQTKEIFRNERGVTFICQFCTHGMPLLYVSFLIICHLLHWWFPNSVTTYTG